MERKMYKIIKVDYRKNLDEQTLLELEKAVNKLIAVEEVHGNAVEFVGAPFIWGTFFCQSVTIYMWK